MQLTVGCTNGTGTTTCGPTTTPGPTTSTTPGPCGGSATWLCLDAGSWELVQNNCSGACANPPCNPIMPVPYPCPGMPCTGQNNGSYFTTGCSCKTTKPPCGGICYLRCENHQGVYEWTYVVPPTCDCGCSCDWAIHSPGYYECTPSTEGNVIRVGCK
jgi:hypothetical protein